MQCRICGFVPDRLAGLGPIQTAYNICQTCYRVRTAGGSVWMSEEETLFRRYMDTREKLIDFYKSLT